MSEPMATPQSPDTVPVQAHRDRSHHRRRLYADYIPDTVIEYVHSLNRRVRWGAVDGVQQSMDSGLDWVPVRTNDIEDRDALALFQRSFDANPDGTFTRADMILQWRSEKSHQEQLADEAEQRALMEDPRHQIEGFEQTTTGLGFVPYGPGTYIPEISDNVVTGYTPDVLEAAKEVEKILNQRKAGEAQSAPSARPQTSKSPSRKKE